MAQVPPDTVLVDRLQAAVPDGELRFLRSSSPLSRAWFPAQPTDLHELLSDYATPDVDEPEEEEVLRLEWRREMVEIRRLLEEIDALDPTVNQSTPEARFDASLERSARALSVWDAYGIPFRLRKNSVFRILSPRDLLGDPIILGVPLQFFIIAVAAKTAHDAVLISRLKRTIERWRGAAIVLCLLFLVAVTI